jgi:quercetin dioxygenase-like cupin family protein
MSLVNPIPGNGVLVLENLLNIREWQHKIPWEPFADKVEIHWLYRVANGPAAALIRFEKGGHVALHEHDGFEHVLVLSGSQTDQNGRLEAGSVMIHSPGTRHSVVSEDGCIVLVVYEKPVRFTERL